MIYVYATDGAQRRVSHAVLPIQVGTQQGALCGYAPGGIARWATGKPRFGKCARCALLVRRPTMGAEADRKSRNEQRSVWMSKRSAADALDALVAAQLSEGG